MGTGKDIRLLSRMDWWLNAAVALLGVISVLFIYSASYRGPGQPMPSFYTMQMLWFGVGLVLYLTAATVDYRLVCQWSTVWYLVAVGLLLLVLVVGVKVYGARRWLGVGRLGIQPAEIAKLAVIVMLGYYLFHRTPEARRQWSTVWGTLTLLSVPFLLIAVEPDLGSALALVPISFAMMFVAGVRVKHLALVALLGLIAGASILPLMWKLKEQRSSSTRKHYQKERLLVFLHPDRDPLGAGWNLNQSLIAVGSGGWTGKGYLKGTQNSLGYLPRTVTPNDFLFSVIAEEKGFVGSVCLLGLYAILLFRGLRIAAFARDRLGMLLATGIVAMLFFHIFINMGMTIGLMPVTGVPLPLLSYGGSFVLASMTALGLLQNIWIHRRVY
jgi:rod shape determining protein RodA